MGSSFRRYDRVDKAECRFSCIQLAGDPGEENAGAGVADHQRRTRELVSGARCRLDEVLPARLRRVRYVGEVRERELVPDDDRELRLL